jgi:hypothetical protein
MAKRLGGLFVILGQRSRIPSCFLGEFGHDQSETRGFDATFDAHLDIDDFASYSKKQRLTIASLTKNTRAILIR